MAQTYQNLLDEVLVLTESVGATDVTEVAKIALIRALRYISRKAELKSLVGQATYNWLSTDVSVSLTGGGGFNISDFDMPYYMMVGDSTETPVPYQFMEYKDWQVLKSYPNGTRYGLDAAISDLRFERAFTIDYSSNVLIDPVVDGKDVTLYYFKVPAAYVAGNSPEIEDGWRDLLTDAAVLICKQYIENPGRILDMTSILKTMDEPIMAYKQHRESVGYRRNFLRISPEYNTRNYYRRR